MSGTIQLVTLNFGVRHFSPGSIFELTLTKGVLFLEQEPREVNIKKVRATCPRLFLTRERTYIQKMSRKYIENENGGLLNTRRENSHQPTRNATVSFAL